MLVRAELKLEDLNQAQGLEKLKPEGDRNSDMTSGRRLSIGPTTWRVGIGTYCMVVDRELCICLIVRKEFRGVNVRST